MSIIDDWMLLYGNMGWISNSRMGGKGYIKDSKRDHTSSLKIFNLVFCSVLSLLKMITDSIMGSCTSCPKNSYKEVTV